MDDVLYLVVPCYNEEEVIGTTAEKLLSVMRKMTEDGYINKKSKILFIDDGSTDNTWGIIRSLHRKNRVYSGIRLTRNTGHQNALLAGLMTARKYADVTISLDADLQDDEEAILPFMKKYREGYDIVYGVRSARKSDTFFKKNTAELFYKLMRLLGADIVFNHADYRLMSKRALRGLSRFPEANLFLRGIVPLVGYRSTCVEYERRARIAGESKYPLSKMLSFALNGITSLSIKPIRVISYIGFIMFIISIAALLYALTVKLLGQTVTGWTTLLISIWMLGGIQLLGVGVIGEYIGKIYNETKKRPKYLIWEELTDE
jgi:glycosyltransferase involved in cell wall biosynthesis